MIAAIDAVINKSVGYRKAGTTFKVPQWTLEDRLKKMKGDMRVEQAAAKGNTYLVLQ